MNKNEFLNELEKRIVKLGNRAECEKTLEYFSEVIDDMIESGMTESAAIEKLGSIDSIIESIQDEFSDEYTEKLTNGEYVTDISAQNVMNIVYEGRNQGVRYEASPDDDYQITTYETDEMGYFIKQDGNDLKIIYYKKEIIKSVKKFFLNLDSTITKPVIIKIPKTFRGNINSTTSNGSVHIVGIAANDIRVTSSNGAIRSIAVATPHLYAKSSNGSIRLDDTAADKIELYTSNGAINMNDTATKTIVMSTSNGPIRLGTIAAEIIDASSSNGRIEFEHIAVSNRLSLKTSNARISGTLAGKMSDYAIRSGTNNGKNNLPNGTNGVISLDVFTSNGRIDVSFSDPL